MNRKVAFWVVVGLCICVAAVWYFPRHTWVAASQDGASGGGFGPDGKGLGYSSATWKSMDGIAVDEVVVSYQSPEEAKKGLEAVLKGEGALVERGSERIVKLSGNPQTGEGAGEVAWVRGTELHIVNAGSLKHALTFERSFLKL